MPDGSPWPKISIITPSFNQANYLEETIRSVLQQGYPNLEYIIIDGGSTDGSVEIIKKYEPWLTYWVSEPDRGQSHAINKGFSQCTGEIINWLNSDDLLLPNSLNEIAKKYHERHSDVFIIAGNAKILSEDGRITNRRHVSLAKGWIKEFGVQYDGGIQASWFLSKALYQLTGPIDESLHFSMDIDYSFRWLEFNPEYLIIKESLAIYRSHSEAKTSKFVKSSMQERRKMYYRHIESLNKNKYSKKRLRRLINKELSGRLIFHNMDKPDLSRIALSLWLNPSRVLTKDFWNIFLK